MGKANDEKKQVNMDESTAAREERDRDIRALMALMEEGDLSALRFDDGNCRSWQSAWAGCSTPEASTAT